MSKKNLALALLSCTIVTMQASQVPYLIPTQHNMFPQQPVIQVIVPNTNTSTSQTVNNNANQSVSNNSNNIDLATIQKTAVDIKNKLHNHVKQVSVTKMFSQWQQKIKTLCENSKKRAWGFFGQLGQLLYDHKFKLAAVGIGATYGYLFFRSKKTNRYLRDSNLWSSWKQELTLEELLAIPQKELAQELQEDIQAHYVTADEPANFLSPITMFIQETDVELEQLKRCASFSSWVIWLGLSRLIPFGIKKEKIIRDRIERLVYLKNIFSSWVAKYKLMSNLSESIT